MLGRPLTGRYQTRDRAGNVREGGKAECPSVVDENVQSLKAACTSWNSRVTSAVFDTSEARLIIGSLRSVRMQSGRQ
jgi:hypothetical protein